MPRDTQKKNHFCVLLSARLFFFEPPRPTTTTSFLVFPAPLHETSAKLDASGAALGRRYARMDELGAPFGVTVDFQTVEDNTVTLRERDSMTQIRMPMAEVAPLVARLVTEEATWEVGRAVFLLFVPLLAHEFCALRMNFASGPYLLCDLVCFSHWRCSFGLCVPALPLASSMYCTLLCLCASPPPPCLP